MAVHFAWLTELGPDCRHDDAAPVSGHAVLRTDGAQPYVSVHITGLRRLRERRPPGTMFYELWLLPADGRLDAAVSVGLFNANAAGAATVQFAWPTPADAEQTATVPGSLLLVTAQHNDGQLIPAQTTVMLGVIGPPAALPAVVAMRRGQPASVVDRPVAPQRAEPQSAVAEPAVLEPSAREPAVLEPAVHQPAVPEPAVPDPAIAEKAPDRSPPVTPAPPAQARGWTFPATLADVPRTCPPGHRLLAEASGALIPIVPDLRTTTGNWSIQFERGQCLITVRGVPAPAVWGSDTATRRPYNVFQAWLRRGRGDETVSLGFFRRIHHDTYRLHYRGAIPFHAFDTIAVNAADRANATPGSGPLLYVATYRHSEPVS